MRKNRTSKTQEALPPVETVVGLTISPETDIPFGKPFRMGFYEYMIYERATEQGYQAGVAAHLSFMHDQGDRAPAMLDDEQFTIMLDAFMPKELPTHDRLMWRSHFIAGWASIFLGLDRVDEPI
jgi:ribosome modulation factor